MTWGVLDIVSLASERDTCIVFPTLSHAVSLWPMYATAVRERHGSDCAVGSKTAITMKCRHTVLRFWVPYNRDPTMPMDFRRYRSGFYFISDYLTEKELRDVARI